MKALRPILFFAAILLVIGLACSAVSGGNSPAQPEATAIQVEPTVSNPPTTAPEPTTRWPGDGGSTLHDYEEAERAMAHETALSGLTVHAIVTLLGGASGRLPVSASRHTRPQKRD